MKKIVACEPATRIIVALVVALLPLAGAGCFRSPDPNKMTCDKASACPSGYYCAIDKKRCIAGAAPSADAGGGAGGLDGASSPLDGIVDRAPPGDGAGGTSPLDLGTGGIILEAGGAGGAIIAAGGAGGIDSYPGSGGTSVVDAPLAGAGGGASGGATGDSGGGGQGQFFRVQRGA